MKKILAILLLSAFTSPAFAYLDPGSISLAFQAILAAIAGLAATYRFWIYKVKEFFGFNKKKKMKTEKKKLNNK